MTHAEWHFPSNAHSIGIPLISSGIFGVPKPICCKALFNAIEKFTNISNRKGQIKIIKLVNIDKETTIEIMKYFNQRTIQPEQEQELKQELSPKGQRGRPENFNEKKEQDENESEAINKSARNEKVTEETPKTQERAKGNGIDRNKSEIKENVDTKTKNRDPYEDFDNSDDEKNQKENNETLV